MRAVITASFVVFVGCTGGDRAPEATSSAERPPAPAEPAAEVPRETPPPAAPPAPAETPVVKGTTPNDFFAAGTPTFIVGTAGDAASDRNVRGQAALLGGLLFPDAEIVDDTTVDPAGGWPPHPVLYGGPHVHATLAALADTLPFTMTADRLEIGGETFEGPGIRLITVLPARGDVPELLVYAGTGDDGVAEINALTKGLEVIAIGDAFGLVTTGVWGLGPDGRLQAKLQPPARRIEWRTVERTLPGAPAGASSIAFRFPAMLPEAADDDAVVQACLRGLAGTAERLRIPVADVPALTVYVHPDRGSKRSLTGNAGDGHAVPAARALHVRRVDPSEGGSLESLLTHEGTHLLVRGPWGAAATAWMGEGVAVWASGQYGGKTLAAWRGELTMRPTTDLLGRGFFSAPEAETYPRAGIFVETAVATIGVEAVRDHLYRATPADWEAACEAAGTTADALDAAVAARLR